MAQSLSVDLRRRAVDAVKGIHPVTQLLSGSVSACRQRSVGLPVIASGATLSLTSAVATTVHIGSTPHRDLILNWVEDEPDLTLQEVAERLDAACGYRPERHHLLPDGSLGDCR